MNRKSVLFLIAVSLLSSLVLTFGSLLYGRNIYMVDFEAVRFGFPYWWVEHVTGTLKGRTDYWFFEIFNLVKNVVLYFLLTFGSSIAIFKFWLNCKDARAHTKKTEKVELGYRGII